MLWFYPNHRTIGQSKKNVHGDCTAPFAKKKKKVQKIGRVTDRQISRGTTTHKPSAPQTYDVPDRYSEQIRLRREWDEKMECLNEKYNLDYYSSSESDSNLSQNTSMKHLYKHFSFSIKIKKIGF